MPDLDSSGASRSAVFKPAKSSEKVLNSVGLFGRSSSAGNDRLPLNGSFFPKTSRFLGKKLGKSPAKQSAWKDFAS